MTSRAIEVYHLAPPIAGARLLALPAGARVGWSVPLGTADLEAVAAWARRDASASIRLYGAAARQIETVLREIPVTRLTLAGECPSRRSPLVPGVRELALEGWFDGTAALLARFAELETLRIDAHGRAFAAAPLAELPSLRRLSVTAATLRDTGALEHSRLRAVELVHCAAADLQPLLRCGSLEALRLAALERLRSVDALAYHASLRVVALERLLHLDSLRPVATLAALESLALEELWQFNVGDAAFVKELPSLRRLTVDFGGRRKNVEIAKWLGLPEADPFELGGYDPTTSYESGVQSVPAYLSSVTTSGARRGFRAENGGV
jgi:hypothetical protein